MSANACDIPFYNKVNFKFCDYLKFRKNPPVTTWLNKKGVNTMTIMITVSNEAENKQPDERMRIHWKLSQFTSEILVFTCSTRNAWNHNNSDSRHDEWVKSFSHSRYEIRDQCEQCWFHHKSRYLKKCTMFICDARLSWLNTELP
jgi:hypothetical protein